MLVVDDTPVNLTVFVNLLKRTGLQIDTAESGDEGIALFKGRKYDVIFLDHMMPDKDGIETLNEMKEIADSPNTGTPVICLTANAISGMREMYTNAGFDDYLTKPIDAEQLEMMLLRYLPKDKVAIAAENDDTDDYVLPDFLYDIKELDIDAGLNYCGDAEDYLMTLETYLESAEKKADEIEKYWAEKDVKNTTVKVHALKSSSQAIGALKLSEFAARLEKAGNEGDLEMLMKRTMRTLFSLSMAAMLLLQGCGSQKKEEVPFTPKYDKDTEFSLTVAGSYRNFESLEAEFERFYEYYPNANLQYVNLDDYNNVISSAIAGSEPPDIFTTNGSMIGNEKYNDMFNACEVFSVPSVDIDYSCIRESLIRTTDSGDVVSGTAKRERASPMLFLRIRLNTDSILRLQVTTADILSIRSVFALL